MCDSRVRISGHQILSDDEDGRTPGGTQQEALAEDAPELALHVHADLSSFQAPSLAAGRTREIEEVRVGNRCVDDGLRRLGDVRHRDAERQRLPDAVRDVAVDGVVLRDVVVGVEEAGLLVLSEGDPVHERVVDDLHAQVDADDAVGLGRRLRCRRPGGQQESCRGECGEARYGASGRHGRRESYRQGPQVGNGGPTRLSARRRGGGSWRRQTRRKAPCPAPAPTAPGPCASELTSLRSTAQTARRRRRAARSRRAPRRRWRATAESRSAADTMGDCARR